MYEPEALLPIRASLGEGPLWVARESALYWVDIDEQKVYRYFPRSGTHEEFGFPVAVTTLGIRARGGFVTATAKGFAFWTPRPNRAVQTLEAITDPEKDRPDNRFNDGAVDRQGRFWAGTMNAKNPHTPTGGLYRLDADHGARIMETGVNIANGCAWSPDCRTMYFTQTGLRTIFAYDFDASSGTITNRRPFVRVPEADGYPDGHAVDAEGYLWTAYWGGWKITRFDPKGREDRSISLPVAQVTSLTFGGENLDELYMTTASTGLKVTALKKQRLAGSLFRVKVGARGMDEPEYAG